MEYLDTVASSENYSLSSDGAVSEWYVCTFSGRATGTLLVSLLCFIVLHLSLLLLLPWRSLCCAQNSQSSATDPRIYLVFLTLHNGRGSRRKGTANSGSTLVCGKCFVFHCVASTRFGATVLCLDAPRHSFSLCHKLTLRSNSVDWRLSMRVVGSLGLQSLGGSCAGSTVDTVHTSVFVGLRNQHPRLLACLCVA